MSRRNRCIQTVRCPARPLATLPDVIFGVCAQKDCFERLPIQFGHHEQRVIDCSAFVRRPVALLESVAFDVEPLHLREDCWAVEMNLRFAVSLEAYAAMGREAVRVSGVAACGKRCLLRARQGSTQTFRSNGNRWDGTPIASLQANEPIALEACLIDDPDSGEAEKIALVSIGIHTITSLQCPAPMHDVCCRAIARNGRAFAERSMCDVFTALPFPCEEF